MEMVDGYGILKTVLFETGHGFGLCYACGAQDKFMVWQFTQTVFGCDYYHGRRFTDKIDAEDDFRRRRNDYQNLYGIKEKAGHGEGKYYRYYSTQRPVDIGTYPKPKGNEPLVIVNYDGDRRRRVAGGLLSAWGELTYPHPLTQKQITYFELVAASVSPETYAKRKENALCV